MWRIVGRRPLRKRPISLVKCRGSSRRWRAPQSERSQPVWMISPCGAQRGMGLHGDRPALRFANTGVEIFRAHLSNVLAGMSCLPKPKPEGFQNTTGSTNTTVQYRLLAESSSFYSLIDERSAKCQYVGCSHRPSTNPSSQD